MFVVELPLSDTPHAALAGQGSRLGVHAPAPPSRALDYVGKRSDLHRLRCE